MTPTVRWWGYTPSSGPSWWTKERHELAVAKAIGALLVDVPLLVGMVVVGALA